MTPQQALEELLPSYQRYFNIKKEDVLEPFDMEAEFISCSEQYFLVKAAKVADIESNEFVYFKTTDNLKLSDYERLVDLSWENGISKVKPSFDHRNTDVTLIIFANHVDADCYLKIKKTRRYKSYCFSLKGFSNFRVVAVELDLRRFVTNRQGQSLKKTFLRYTK